MHQQALASALAVVLAAAPTAMANAIYTKNSPVLQVDAKNFDRLINRSNHTSVRPAQPPPQAPSRDHRRNTEYKPAPRH